MSFYLGAIINESQFFAKYFKDEFVLIHNFSEFVTKNFHRMIKI